MGRALLIKAKLPKILWTYSLMAVSYISNGCFVKRINSTPYGFIALFPYECQEVSIV